MSADNFYRVGRDDQGHYCVTMGFMSDEELPKFRELDPRFDTKAAAMDFASLQYSEYGIRVDPDIADIGKEVYVRGAEGTDHAGECKWLPLKEGIEYFLSDHGYRLSIELEGMKFVLRKDCTVEDQQLDQIDQLFGHKSVNAVITISSLTDDYQLQKK